MRTRSKFADYMNDYDMNIIKNVIFGEVQPKIDYYAIIGGDKINRQSESMFIGCLSNKIKFIYNAF